MNFTGKINQILSAINGRSARVLGYHSISDSPDDPLSISPEEFRKHIAFLHAHDFCIISPNALAGMLRNGDSLTKKVVITFDDAFNDFYFNALPILVEYHFSATVFIPTAFISKMSTWVKLSPARPVMNLTQLEEVLKLGIEFGSHTVNHISLVDTSQENLENEFIDSMNFIRQLTGQEEISMAYPFGMAGVREQMTAQLVGYSCAFLPDGLWGCSRGSNLYALPREAITRNNTLSEFTNQVSGRADLHRLTSDLLTHINYPWARSRKQSPDPNADM